jgi:hypothetical protein
MSAQHHTLGVWDNVCRLYDMAHVGKADDGCVVVTSLVHQRILRVTHADILYTDEGDTYIIVM